MVFGRDSNVFFCIANKEKASLAGVHVRVREKVSERVRQQERERTRERERLVPPLTAFSALICLLLYFLHSQYQASVQKLCLKKMHLSVD